MSRNWVVQVCVGLTAAMVWGPCCLGIFFGNPVPAYAPPPITFDRWLGFGLTFGGGIGLALYLFNLVGVLKTANRGQLSRREIDYYNYRHGYQVMALQGLKKLPLGYEALKEAYLKRYGTYGLQD